MKRWIGREWEGKIYSNKTIISRDNSYGRFAAGWRWGGLRWGHEDRVGVKFFYTNPSLPETSFSHQNEPNKPLTAGRPYPLGA